MRQRTISPGFFTNEALTELPPLARLAFAGLWLLADRAGRVEDRPRRVKALLFPYETMTDEAMDALLVSLERSGFIRRYEVDGCKYLSVENFGKHQHPHPKEKASVIPAPPKSREKVEPSRVKDSTSRAGPSVPSGPSGPSEITDLPPPAESKAPTRFPKPKDTWLTAYCDAWKARWGEESDPPAGEMASALAKAEKALRGDRRECVTRWTRFLAQAQTSQWARPSRFAQGLGEWARDPPPGPASVKRGARLQATPEQYAAADASRQAEAERVAKERDEWLRAQGGGH